MKTEKVFEILGEGGGICIYRQKNTTEVTYLYHHSEFDPTEEGHGVNDKGEYLNFETPFQLVHKTYEWFMLHLYTVHVDYRDYIIIHLIEKLNGSHLLHDQLKHSKDQLEHVLKIKLKCIYYNKRPIWNFTKTVVQNA